MTDTPAPLQEAQAAIDAAQTAIDNAAAESNQFESNSSGLRQAAAELQQARAEAEATTPPPAPSASDILSGPGLEQKITLPGDKPVSVRNAARSLSALHELQQQEIAQIDAGLAHQGYSWDQLLSGEVVPVSKDQAPDAAPAAPAAQPSAELDATKAELAQAQRKAAAYEADRQEQAKFDALSESARRHQYALVDAVRAAQQIFPDIVTQEDLQKAWVQNPARAAEFTKVFNGIQSWSLQGEALVRRAADEAQRVNAKIGDQQDAAFESKHPEFAADRKQMAALQRQAFQTLKDAGFSEQELGKAWTGEDKLFLRDHRVQSFLLGHLNLLNEHEALKERLGIAQKSMKPGRDLAPVRKPGVSQDRDTGSAQQIQATRRALSKATTQRSGAMAAVNYMQALRKGGKL
jgi:hypothetical protein